MLLHRARRFCFVCPALTRPVLDAAFGRVPGGKLCSQRVHIQKHPLGQSISKHGALRGPLKSMHGKAQLCG